MRYYAKFFITIFFSSNLWICEPIIDLRTNLWIIQHYNTHLIKENSEKWSRDYYMSI